MRRQMKKVVKIGTPAALLGAALLILGQGQTQGAAAPFQIGYSAPAEALAPLLVSFKATVPAGYRVDWDFGDGTRASGAELEHVFYRPQNYTINVQVSDSAGRKIGTAATSLSVKSAGAERAALTLLLAPSGVRLSEVGSVSYAPHSARYWIDGKEIPVSRTGNPVKSEPVALSAGPHRATVQLQGSAGMLQSSVTFTMAPVTTSEAFNSEVLRLTNQARAQGFNCQTKKAGGAALSPLTRDPTLDSAAQAQSVGLALGGYFDHKSAIDGSSPSQRLLATGLKVSRSGENIAAGQTTPAQVVDGWLHSLGHCHNIMGDFTHIGLSYVYRAESEDKTYWTQVFAKP